MAAGIQEGVEKQGDTRKSDREATGDDQELVAPPGTTMPAVATVLAMPISASGRFSHLRTPNGNLIVSPGAKLRILQLRSCEVLLVRSTSGQKGETYFGALKQKIFGQEKSRR